MDSLPYYLERFDREGCVVIPDFLSRCELEAIKREVAAIVDRIDESATQRAAFNTSDDQIFLHDRYLLESADRVSYFFEVTALDGENKLVVPKSVALNKIGHALHWRSEIFRDISFKPAVKNLVRQLGFLDPVIVQSMYIFKHPKIGGEVMPHTDCSFLYVKPCKLVGLWFAVEEVTKENGCLWYVPGSHRTETVTRRMVRTPQSEKGPPLTFIGHQREFSSEEFVPLPVPAGGLVLIHGQVVHKSEKNISDKPRPAYTFHVFDTHETEYAADNWLQPTTDLSFTKLYEN